MSPPIPHPFQNPGAPCLIIPIEQTYWPTGIIHGIHWHKTCLDRRSLSEEIEKIEAFARSAET